MPRKTTSRGRARRQKRKMYKRRKGKYTLRYKSSTSGIPERYFCKLKLVDNFSVGAGTNPSALEHYRLNGIYDPYVGVGGHAPRGFNQLAALYQRYRVHKARVVFNANYIDESNQLWIALLEESGQLPGFAWIYDACEKEGTLWHKQTNRTGAKFLKKNYDMAHMLGMTREQYRTSIETAANTSGMTGTLPALQNYVGLACANLDETTNIDTDEVNYNVTIIYYVEFFDKVSLATS